MPSRTTILSAIILITLVCGIFAPLAFAQTGDENTKDPAPSLKEVVLNKALSFVVLDFMKQILLPLGVFLLTLSGAFLGIAGGLLDIAINFSTNTLGQYPELVDTARVAWKIFRDLINISFIFILLFTSIQTILGLGDYKKVVRNVVIAALLINFSFFFTSVAIDASNILTGELYRPIKAFITTSTPHNPNIGDITLTDTYNSAVYGVFGVAATFVKITGLTDVFNVAISGDNSAAMYSIMASLFFFIAAFIFLSSAIFFIVRIVTLLFLLATSPVGFAGNLLPGIGKYTKQWRDSLWSQLTFPPLYMLLTLTAFFFADGMKKVFLTNGVPSTFEGIIGSSAGWVFNFSIASALMITALTVAKSATPTIAKKITGWWTDGIASLTGMVTAGTVGFAGRELYGRTGVAIQKSDLVGRGLKSKNLLYQYAAKTAALGGRAVSESSFDVRGTGLGKFIPGTAQKGGLLAAQEARAKRAQARAETYAQSIAVQNQREDVEAKRLTLSTATPGKQRDDAQKALESAMSALKEMEGGFGASRAREDLEKATQALTAQQLKEAETTARVIEAKEKQIKDLKSAAEYAPDDEKAQSRFEEAQRQLETFKKESNYAQYQTFIDAQKAVAAAQGVARTMVSAAKQTVGLSMAGSPFAWRRQASDELRKQTKSADQNLLDELKKLMAAGAPAPEQPQKTQPSSGTETPPPTSTTTPPTPPTP